MSDGAVPQASEVTAAATELSNAVYAATGLFEDLENDGKLTDASNGHHMRQEVASFAERLLRARWKGTA